MNLPFEVMFHLAARDFAITKLKISRLTTKIKPYNLLFVAKIWSMFSEEVKEKWLTDGKKGDKIIKRM